MEVCMKNFIVSLVVFVLFMGCQSTQSVRDSSQGVKPASESGTIITAQKTFVRDWQGRSLNEPAIPVWLGPATRGDYTLYQSAFKINTGSEIYRNSEATGADVRAATMRADLAYSRKIARELQQSINVYAAESARAGNMNEATAQAIQERTSTETHVDITGHQKKTEFWQLLETEDISSGQMTKNYIAYQIYAINPNVWTQTTAKYIREVIGELPRELSLEAQEVNDMMIAMINDARFPKVLSQEQAKVQVDAQKKMVDAQISLIPAEQRAAAQAELARIIQQGATERTQIVADSRTVQIQAVADAHQTAYLSGNPVYTAAASTTVADADWVNAMALASPLLYGD
jgi:uncharacterized protein YceK